MFETRKSGNKTSSGDNGLNIRAYASPKVGQEQVSGGVSVPCRHSTPVADALLKPTSGKMSDSVKMSSSGGVNVLCRHAAPVANVLWKPLAIRKKSNKVIRSRSVIGSKIGVMPN